jgi:hypothetical protein
MWMLDQVRCRMPRKLRGAGITNDIYKLEAKLSEEWKKKGGL